MKIDLQVLSQVLTSIPPFRETEDTIFSIGGRGYYENPATDMLAYFMQPKKQHGFGSLFLETFFACMGIKAEELCLDGIRIEREENTSTGRLDLLIVEKKWILIIENKIRHWIANDLEEYASHVADKFPGRHQYLAILSPEYETIDNWKSVTYKDYCSALRRSLEPLFARSDSSKWSVLAKDFISHLETNVYTPMIELDQQQIDFVEKHIQQVASVNSLATGYHGYILMRLKGMVREVFGREVPVSEEDWAFTFNDAEIPCFYLRTPLHKDSEQHFHVGLWTKSLSQRQQNDVRGAFEKMDMNYSGQEGGGWNGQWTTPTRALEAFRGMIETLARVLRINNGRTRFKEIATS